MKDIEIFLAFSSVIGALIGLITAIISRKKVIEIRHTTYYESERTDIGIKKWYDKYIWLFIWILFFFPVGYYGLYKSRTVYKGWKIVIPIIHIILLVSSSKN